MGERWARFVGRHRVAVLRASRSPALVVVAIPAAEHAARPARRRHRAPETTQRKAYDLISDGFGAGRERPADGRRRHRRRATTRRPRSTQAVAAASATSDIVACHAAAAPTATGDTALLTVIPKTGPSDAATEDLVHAIRAAAGPAARQHRARHRGHRPDRGEHRRVGEARRRVLPYLALIVGLAFLLLMLVFRSVLVPLKATLGFLLGGGDVRRGGRGVPVGLAHRPARRRVDRADHEHAADPADRHPVRPRHGLPGVPGDPDARGATCTARQPREAVVTGFRARRPGGRRGRADHDRACSRASCSPRTR